MQHSKEDLKHMLLTLRAALSSDISSLHTSIFLCGAGAPQSCLSLLLVLCYAWIHLGLQQFQSFSQVIT